MNAEEQRQHLLFATRALCTSMSVETFCGLPDDLKILVTQMAMVTGMTAVPWFPDWLRLEVKV